MSHLPHLDSSLRTEESRSRKLSAHYAARWQAKNPDGITYRGLAAGPIPHLDNVAVSSEFVAAPDRTPEQAAARALADKLITMPRSEDQLA